MLVQSALLLIIIIIIIIIIDYYCWLLWLSFWRIVAAIGH